jgi:hypothetical protein
VHKVSSILPTVRKIIRKLLRSPELLANHKIGIIVLHNIVRWVFLKYLWVDSLIFKTSSTPRQKSWLNHYLVPRPAIDTDSQLTQPVWMPFVHQSSLPNVNVLEVDYKYTHQGSTDRQKKALGSKALPQLASRRIGLSENRYHSINLLLK